MIVRTTRREGSGLSFVAGKLQRVRGGEAASQDDLGDVFVSEGTESLERCSPEVGRDKKLNSVERLICSLVQHSTSFELLEQRESGQIASLTSKLGGWFL
jgi:hypothetical protein